MELKFTKDAQSGNYVSELEVKAGFNLHIEGAKKLRLYQRTAGSRYDEIEGEYKNGPYSFDYDFDALVYPKFIKIVSEVEPTYAEVVSDGEITEIKSQSKEVEITANGTTQVAPDAGFSYLTGVTVKTNVPMSGAPGGGGGDYEYIDIREVADTTKAPFCIYSALARTNVSGQDAIIPFGMFIEGGLELVLSQSKLTSYVCIDFNLRVIMGEEESTLEKLISDITGLNVASLPRITEEEFYNLEGGG